MLTALSGAKSRDTQTDGQGHYRFLDLPAGKYRLEAEFLCFRKATRRLKVEAGRNLHADIILKLASCRGIEVDASRR
jgi:carboxypeptidase family protein